MTDTLLAVALCGLAGAVLVRWLWYPGVAFGAGLLAGVAFPEQVETILAVSQCVAWLVGIRVLLGEQLVVAGDGSLRRSQSLVKGLRSSTASSPT